MIEIAKEGLETWDGTLPRFLMGTPDMGGAGMLLNVQPTKVVEDEE
jgi:hypothetical protein